MMSKRSLLVAILAVAAWSAQAGENDWFIKSEKLKLPKAARKNINSAEAVMELPGPPALPMRQSERKKPPQPDYLLAKVIWGESASFTASSGHKMPIDDWNLVDNDAERLVERGRAYGLSYQFANANLAEFSYDPRKMPSLFFSGVRSLRLSSDEIQSLRSYVLRGGMIVCDSVYGSPYFYESAKKTFLEAFPEASIHIVPLDHPIYHLINDIKTVGYPEDPQESKPFMEAIYVGSRIGVLFLKYGIGTGLDGDQTVFAQLKERGLKPLYVDQKSAARIAENLAGYVVGFSEVGTIEGSPEMFGLPDQKRPTDEFVFAQIKHEGAWNVHPGAATTLMNRLRQHSAVRLNMKRLMIDPGKDDLSTLNFLYLTGLDDFKFSDREVDALHTFIKDGGVLVVNNGLGLATFHQAALRELGRILPGQELKPIPPDHPLYNSLMKIDSVEYTAALAKKNPELGHAPLLMGLYVDNDLRVIYSPYDMEAGWQNTYYPLLLGYSNESAQELGMNLITYLISH